MEVLMNDPRRRSRSRWLLLAGLMVAAVGSAGTVATPALAAVGCDFTMVSLKARNLDKDGGTDYVFLKVDTTWFPAGNNGVAFQLNDVRQASNFGNPTMGYVGSMDVKLVLDKFPANHTVERETFSCTTVTNAVRTFSDNDSIYDLTYSVS
ncbi:hypothetical protein Ait01nite_057250 [Actinoplanes italicus]|uniref:Uncharacterized protein n=2 Tax=Actinoplanes italicus TaxID=113567 RepID=A0A2T0K5N8_9ACTN|nr:hypothetical protein CLV67_113108 [Actinoplanes italicus]GIE32680.1 hypothetical protein Ait01nite_057250 [Actinoplanes italicus]